MRGTAKLNSAQVEQQTGIHVGKGGMEVKVGGNTHLGGAVIASEAERTHNRLQAGTLTTADIRNYSELNTKSAAISGGSGGINPMSALSLLGNQNDQAQSTTYAAIGNNIDITLTDDPNAERTLKNLNRDIQNANEKVTKHDLSKVKETEEIVKGIREIAEKALQIYTHHEREKVEQAKLELGQETQRAKARGVPVQQLDDDPQVKWAAKQLAESQQAYDKEYGTGSPTRQVVNAVTAALQGLAAKDTGQAIVGLASPYLNQQIKRHTQNADGSVNPEANLVAHALLGAVEAKITGNNALAGAAAGVAGEGAAMVMKHGLYPNKKLNELTESEKQNVVFLSQLAGGLAVGVVGDSTQSAAMGADVAKRAVENNFLSTASRRRLNELITKRSSGKELTEKEKFEFLELAYFDQKSDVLVKKQQRGEKLSALEKQDLDRFIERFITETVSGRLDSGQGKKYSSGTNKEVANVLLGERYLNNVGYKPNYSYPYVLGHTEEWRDKSAWKADEAVYREVFNELNNRPTLPQTWQELAQEMQNAVVAKGRGNIPNATNFSIRVPKKVVEKEQSVVVASKNYENQSFRVSGGEYRANLYSKNWETASLVEAIDKFAGKRPNIIVTDKGKRIYENPTTNIQVVEDLNGKYFRIFDPNIIGKRAYLDLSGKVPSNKELDNGKIMVR